MENFAVKQMVPDQIFTDRQPFIDHFYKLALNAIDQKTSSTVLLGHRRMGKTEIFRRVVNRLFFEQDVNKSCCIPVYYEFPKEISNRNDFAIDYLTNFLKWYTAFKMRNENIIIQLEVPQDLIEFIQNNIPNTVGINASISLLKGLIKNTVPLPEQKALKSPSIVANYDNIAIAMFLDEFQNTSLPQYNYSIVGYMKEPVESINCPHFVTGSTMSILSDEILGKGALYGRFDYEHIKPLTPYYSEELVLKAANYYEITLSHPMASHIALRCGGNPFYINSVIRQAARKNISIDSLKALDKIMVIDICSGFIWGELSDQVNFWISRINQYGITRWILYLAALEENEQDINIQRIQAQLKLKENIDVSLDKIKEVLIKLARGDLLEYKAFGDWFGKIQDPVLNEFLKVWGLIEIERQEISIVQEQSLVKLQRTKKQFDEYKGYISEVFIAQFLWNTQGQTFSGHYFNSKTDVKVSDYFFYIDQRVRQSAGKNMEVDIYAAADNEIWLIESKCWKKPVGNDVVLKLFEQSKHVQQRNKEDIRSIKLWIFANEGLTESAKKLCEQHKILWSSKDNLNGLLEKAKLRKLPDIPFYLQETSTIYD
ncbi:ATPase domain protein, prokaryote domain protein [Candidatus Magnetomorum sp. HK-1]|nr:ATPase domain protein, prokaryote domain protein [Candidatus Magnetomorum sp. HK-1]